MMVTFTGAVTAPAEQMSVTVPAETVVVPERIETVTTTERTLVAAIDVDLTNLKTVLRLAGWPEDKVDIGQAIAMAESSGYSDAVGDISLVDAKWGPSIGLFQIRSLRHPGSFGGLDLWRYAWPLRQPFFNAAAALAQSKGGTDFTPWSVWESKSYEQYLGGNPTIKTGHTAAASWWK